MSAGLKLGCSQIVLPVTMLQDCAPFTLSSVCLVVWTRMCTVLFCLVCLLSIVWDVYLSVCGVSAHVHYTGLCTIHSEFGLPVFSDQDVYRSD